jgi:hypothetical protein
MDPPCGDDVAAKIHERLTSHGAPALRQVSWQFRKGVLVLSGQVPSFYLKQVAQEVVANLDEVLEVVNCIEVVEPAA